MKSWLAAAAAVAGWCAGGANAADCKLGRLLELKVSMDGRSPTITTAINGREAKFTADSGAWYSMISPGVAAELGLKQRPAPDGFYVTGVGGQMVDLKVTTADTFGIGTSTLKKVDFLVGGSEVGNTGLIGENILAIGDAEFDFANGFIRLFRVTGCRTANLAYWTKPGDAYSTVDLTGDQSVGSHILGTIIVNGTRLRAMFDTGADTSTMTRSAAARIGIRPNSDKVVDAGFSSGIGRKYIRSWIAPVASIKIGDEEIKNTHIRFGDMTDDDYDMLVGADFFLSHHVYVARGQRKLYLSYGGGPVFDLSTDKKKHGAPAPVASTLPKLDSAEAYRQRAAVEVARGDRANARADLDDAIKLDGKRADLRIARAELFFELKNRAGAMADLDQAIATEPASPRARLLRAEARLGDWTIDDDDTPAGSASPPKTDAVVPADGSKKGEASAPAVKAKPSDADEASAVADLDAASAALSPQSDDRLWLANLFSEAHRPAPAAEEYARWIAVHKQDRRYVEALNGQCWSLALANRSLPVALAACNTALRLVPRTASILDSRAMVKLRMGDAKGALGDYDAAIAKMPKSAWSHYGRGLAKLKLGDKAGGSADLAEASKLDPDISAMAKRYGVE